MKEYGIVVCASGGGGNFKSLIDHQGLIGFSILKLIVDRTCGAISVAEKSGVKVEIIKYKGNSNFSEDFINAIPVETDLIVLAGFLPILPEIVCERFKYKIINTHPSLLPKYGGKGMCGVKIQEAVMANHEKKAGCTVHYVTSDVDAGDIILQKEVDVDYSETPWQLGGRIFNEEIKLLPEAIRILKEQRHIMVSVCCLVYNHKPFLRECFDGFVMQKTTFSIEILVHDDASTDHSADIIREYTAKYPDLFKPIYQTENQYSKGVNVLAKNLMRSKGKYIAICEGDDYWTDPLKLQKQVEFMEEHNDIVVTYHDVMTVDINNRIINRSFLSEERKVNFAESILKKGVWIMPQTMCFRAKIKEVAINKLNGNVKNGDIFITSIMGNYGAGVYLSDIKPTAYRQTALGIWSMQNSSHKALMMISTCRELLKFYKKRSDDEFVSYYKKKIKQLFSNFHSCSFSSQDKKWYISLIVKNIGTIGLKNSLHYLKTLYF